MLKKEINGKTVYHYATSKAARREQLMDWIRSGDFHADITLVANIPGLRLERLYEMVGEFFYRVEVMAIQRRVSKLPTEKRISGILFPEHLQSNLHVHGTLMLPDHLTREEKASKQFCQISKVCWEKVCGNKKPSETELDEQAIQGIAGVRLLKDVSSDICLGPCRTFNYGRVSHMIA